MSIGHKYPAVDLLKLYSQGNEKTWCDYLLKVQKTKDFEGALKMRFGLQAGMDDLVKKRLDTTAIHIWFSRLIVSIEKNLRWIYREKYPNPLDNPLNKKGLTNEQFVNFRRMKRERDQNFEIILKQWSY